jgi:hypothetical protein
MIFYANQHLHNSMLDRNDDSGSRKIKHLNNMISKWVGGQVHIPIYPYDVGCQIFITEMINYHRS